MYILYIQSFVLSDIDITILFFMVILRILYIQLLVLSDTDAIFFMVVLHNLFLLFTILLMPVKEFAKIPFICEIQEIIQCDIYILMDW